MVRKVKEFQKEEEKMLRGKELKADECCEYSRYIDYRIAHRSSLNCEMYSLEILIYKPGAKRYDVK